VFSPHISLPQRDVKTEDVSTNTDQQQQQQQQQQQGEADSRGCESYREIKVCWLI